MSVCVGCGRVGLGSLTLVLLLFKSPIVKNQPTGHFTAVTDDSECWSTEGSFMWVAVPVKGQCDGLWVKKKVLSLVSSQRYVSS